MKNDQIYRPGLEGVLADQTAICKVDPEAGQLLYRGYEVKELARHSHFEEVAYLLLYGRLPKREELEIFFRELGEQREIPALLLEFYRQLPRSAPPMEVLRTSVSILSLYDPEARDNSYEANLRKAARLMAKIPTLIGNHCRISQGLDPTVPDPHWSMAEKLLRMLGTKRDGDLPVKVMDKSLILYAEHDFNASTFCARVTSSTLSDLHSAIVSAIGTLKGPLHGGANEEAMRMLLEIGSVDRAEAWVLEALAQKRRVMGFGHRVYKKGDSRANIMKSLLRDLGDHFGETQWIAMTERIEKIMLQEKGLYPNVDFYSAPAYYLLGIPIELYTPIFVASRISGWCAHVIEQHQRGRLIRPLSGYIGPPPLKYVPIEKR